MPIIASANSTPKELIEAGNYVARCYQMIQIGTVTEIINGESKILKKVRIGWELPTEQKVFKEENGLQPLVVNEEYTLSLSEKANLRKMLASWRGKDFTTDEAKSFDITALIGKACMLNIIHQPSKGDPTRIYSKIGSVSNVPKGLTVPSAINDVFLLSYDNFDWNKYNSLPDFIKDKMKVSIEFKSLTADIIQPVSLHEDGKPAPVRDMNGNVMPEDDLPF